MATSTSRRVQVVVCEGELRICDTALPDKFMKVSGQSKSEVSSPFWYRSHLASPGTSPEPSREKEPEAFKVSLTLSNRRNPKLWRVATYFGPGLPRPTSNRKKSTTLKVRSHSPLKGPGLLCFFFGFFTVGG